MNPTVIVNVTPKDSPAKIEAFLAELKSRGISARAPRGAAAGTGEDEPREMGPWEKAYCEASGFSRVRRTGGRSHEQQAFHMFETSNYERPKGLRKPTV
jgi:hypothetical protein